MLHCVMRVLYMYITLLYFVLPTLTCRVVRTCTCYDQQTQALRAIYTFTANLTYMYMHCYPSPSQEAALTATGWYEGTQLTKAAGKFIVLEKMLRKLRTQGHRVLIFSQVQLKMSALWRGLLVLCGSRSNRNIYMCMYTVFLRVLNPIALNAM